MKKLTKLLILLLSVALIVTALAVVISANDSGTVESDIFAWDNGSETGTGNLTAALEAVAEDGKITLTGHLTVSEPIVLGAGVSFDLGGYKITNTADTAVFELTDAIVTGQGAIETAGPVAVARGESAVTGTGYGIKVTGSTGTVFSVEEYLKVELVDAKITAASEKGAIALAEGAIFLANNLSLKVTAENAEGYAIYAPGAEVVITNSSIETPGNGYYATPGTLSYDNENVVYSVGADFIYGEGAVDDVALEFGFNNCVVTAGGNLLNATSGDAAAAENTFVGFENSEVTLTGTGSAVVGYATVEFDEGTQISLGDSDFISANYADNKNVTVASGVRLDKWVKELNATLGYSPMANPALPFVCGSGDGSTHWNGYSLVDKIGTMFDTSKFSTKKTNSPNVGLINSFAEFHGAISYVEDIDGDGTASVKYSYGTFDGDGNFTLGFTNDIYTTENKNYGKNLLIDNGDETVTFDDARTYFGTTGKVESSTFKVLVFEMEITVDLEAGVVPILIRPTRKKTSTGSNGFGDTIAISETGKVTCDVKDVGTVVEGQLKNGKNRIQFVMGNEASRDNGHVFLNDEHIGNFNYAGGSTSTIYQLTDFRITINEGTYKNTDYVIFDDFKVVKYTSILNGVEVNSAEGAAYYLGYPSEAPATPYSVNGVGYATIEEAIAATEAEGVANVISIDEAVEANLEIADYTGYILTNGKLTGTITNTSVSGNNGNAADANGNVYYHFDSEVYGEPVDVTWYYGADLGTSAVTESIAVGVAPEAPQIPAFEFDHGNYTAALSLSGWTTSPIEYEGKTVEGYLAAVEAADVLTSLPKVTASEGGAPRTYYAVYSCSVTSVKVTFNYGAALGSVESGLVEVGAAPAAPAGKDVIILGEESSTVLLFAGWSTTHVVFEGDVEAYLAAAEGAELVSEFPAVKEADSSSLPVYYAVYGEVKSDILAKVENGGNVTYYKEVSAIEALFKNFTNGDVVTLMGNVTFTGTDVRYTAPNAKVTLTIDLNGYTLDRSSSYSKTMISASSNSGPDVTIKSSRVGGVLNSISPAGENGSALINYRRKDRTATFEGQDSQGNTTLTVNCAGLYTNSGYGSSSGTNSGTKLTINGGVYNMVSKSTNGFIGGFGGYLHQDNGKKYCSNNTSTATVTDATINIDCDSYLLRASGTYFDFNSADFQEGGKYYGVTKYGLGETATVDFVDCVINDNSTPENGLLSIEFPVITLSFTGCNVNGVLNNGDGRVVIGEGTTFSGYNVNSEAGVIEDYSGYEQCIYEEYTSCDYGMFTATGVQVALYDGIGAQNYKVVSAANVQAVEFYDKENNSLGTANYAKDANFANILFSGSIDGTKSGAIGTVEVVYWTKDEANSTDALVRLVPGEVKLTAANEPKIDLSATLSTELVFNVYISEDFYKILREEEQAKYKMATKQGSVVYYIETEVDATQLTDSFYVDLVFSQFGATKGYRVTFDVADYAMTVLEDETSSTKDVNIVYHMMNFAECFAINNGATGSEAGMQKLAEVINTYFDVDGTDDTKFDMPEMSNFIGAELPESTTDRSALAGKLMVAVDLKTNPEYVFTLVDGTEADCIVIKDLAGETLKTRTFEEGEACYATAGIYEFADAFEIELMNGKTVVAEGTFCYLDYVASAKATDGTEGDVWNDELANLLAVFYDYILYAQNFERS